MDVLQKIHIRKVTASTAIQESHKRPFLEARARTVRAVRARFDARGFTEVDPPCVVPCPTMDVHVHGFAVPEAGGFLHCSPEFHMKQLLAAGWERIYALGPVWRREVAGPWHAPEFTMLEWYRVHEDYQTLIQDCKDILCAVSQTFFTQDLACDPNGTWEIITVAQAFERYVDIDLSSCLNDTPRLAAAARNRNVRVADGDGWDDIFHAVMAQHIEPRLGSPAPTVLTHYPAHMAALARLAPGDPRWAERAELYICGMEVANGFSELTNPEEQRARFVADAAEKHRLYGFSYTPDEAFLAALESGMPESAGMALGLDRLVMLATGAEHIGQVRWG